MGDIEKLEACPACGAASIMSGFNPLSQSCLCGWRRDAADERRSLYEACSGAPRDWWRDLLAAQRRLRDRHEAIARVLDATGHPLMPQQAAILPYLADRHERTVTWLTDHAYVGKNNSYNLRVLADKGYLVARPGHDDRRQRFFRLTDKGALLADLLIATMQSGEGKPHG